MSNAFAPIVRARPNPIFGRPVHQGSPPIDYSPILLLKPFGFRIAPDTLSSDENLVGQRGITPAFGYSAPHPGAGGTLTLLIHALPSAHYELLRPCAPHRYSDPCGSSHSDVSLCIGATGSHVPYKSLIRLRAAYVPDVARAVFRTASELIPGARRPPGFDSAHGISTLHQRFACARLSGSHLTGSLPAFCCNAAESARGVSPRAAHRSGL